MLRNMVRLGGRLLIICLVSGLALAATFQLTAPVKAANEQAKVEEGLRVVYPDAPSFELLDDQEIVKLKGEGNFSGLVSAYRTGDGGALVTLTAQGYHEMTVMVGIKADGTITGYQVLSHTETANLGDKVTREDFISQFKGKSTPVAYEDGVEAVSGATKSSNGILQAVNTAAEIAQKLGGV